MIWKGSYWLVFIRYKRCTYLIFQYDQQIFFILVFILLIAYQCHLFLGYFSKMKEIMSVNTCQIFSFEICYDKISDCGQLCAFLPNYWPWSLWKVLFTWFLHIWQAFRLSRTTFVKKVCIKFEYVCKPVFCEHYLPLEATYIQVTKLGGKGTYDLLYKNPYFFVTSWPNQMGSSIVEK